MIDLKETAIKMIEYLPQESNNSNNIFIKVEYQTTDSLWVWMHFKNTAKYIAIKKNSNEEKVEKLIEKFKQSSSINNLSYLFTSSHL